MADLFARHPRRPAHLRSLLLDDPPAFAYVLEGAADLTLSGRTHGGEIGLVSLGLEWTVLAPTRWPDHGFCVRGRNRLQVQRGTGFYGFPLRIGVSGRSNGRRQTPPPRPDPPLRRPLPHR